MNSEIDEFSQMLMEHAQDNATECCSVVDDIIEVLQEHEACPATALTAFIYLIMQSVKMAENDCHHCDCVQMGGIIKVMSLAFNKEFGGEMIFSEHDVADGGESVH